MSTASRRCLRDTGAPVRIVVLGETAKSLAWAVHLELALRQGVGAEYELIFSWWKFDWLRDLTMRREANQATMEADIIIVLSVWDKKLPPTINDCLINGLVSGASKNSRLLALLETNAHASGNAVSLAPFFLHLGKTGGMVVYLAQGFFDVGREQP